MEQMKGDTKSMNEETKAENKALREEAKGNDTKAAVERGRGKMKSAKEKTKAKDKDLKAKDRIEPRNFMTWRPRPSRSPCVRVRCSLNGLSVRPRFPRVLLEKKFSRLFNPGLMVRRVRR